MPFPIRFPSACALTVALVVGAMGAESSPFDRAQALERAGQTREAFEAYLAIPGAEGAARALAVNHPQELLPLLDRLLTDPLTRLHAMLLDCDLRRAGKEKSEVLACYQRTASLIARDPGRGWTDGVVPSDFYFSDLTSIPFVVDGSAPFRSGGPLPPFVAGPGSHRDNWLVRRFIALAAWDDAARELARIRSLHERRLENTPYDGIALEFLLDHAFFLRQRGRRAEAETMLTTAMARVDLDPVRTVWFNNPRPWVDEGISAKEFIRLVYGLVKSSPAERDLVTRLEAEIQGGNPRARRVLARLRSLQGDPDRALALEIETLDAQHLAPLADALGRGQLLQEFTRNADAIAVYEKALVAPQLVATEADRRLALTGLERLHALYVTTGNSSKAFELRLRQFDLDEYTFADLSRLETELAEWKTSGRRPRFLTWAAAKVDRVKTPAVRANLHWILGHRAKTIEAIADDARGSRPRRQAFTAWKKRFAAISASSLHSLVAAIAGANPDDLVTRLELFDLDRVADGPAYTAVLERLLEREDRDVWSALLDGDLDDGKAIEGARHPTATLAQLYARSRKVDALVALAARLGKAAAPAAPEGAIFTEFDTNRHDANAAIAIAIANASTSEQFNTLEAALSDPFWSTARVQLARARQRHWPTAATATDVGWANIPSGMRVIASNESVLDFVADQDGTRIFTGHPWGVMVYDGLGHPITRIATGMPALQLVRLGTALWVRDSESVTRIQLPGYALARMKLPLVQTMAGRGESLWIVTAHDVRRYDTRNNEMRVFPETETGFDRDWDSVRILFEGEHVSFSARQGLSRYDTRNDAWERLTATPAAAVIPPAGGLGRIHAEDQWRRLPLADGTVAVAHRSNNNWTTEYGEAFTLMESHEASDGVSGLRLRLPDGTSRHVSDGFGDSMLGDHVYGIVVGPDQNPWLLTNHGISELDPSDRVIRTMTQSDGLASNEIRSVVTMSGKSFLSSESGLIVYDPASTVFTSLRPGDGLASERVTAVRRVGLRLEMSFGAEYNQRSNGKVTYTPQTFNPATGRFGPVSLPIKADEPFSPTALEARMPYLGGFVIDRKTIGGKTYLVGTRGVVILSSPLVARRAVEVTTLDPRVSDPDRANLREAEALHLSTPIGVARLAELVRSPNPYIVAEAVANAGGTGNPPAAGTVPLVSPLATHPFFRVRAAAVRVLSRATDAGAVEPLRTALADSNPLIRSLAAISLAQRGLVPDAAYFRPLLRGHEMRSYPYGAAGTESMELTDEAYLALGAHADRRDIAALLVEFAPNPERVAWAMKDFYTLLGGSVGRHGELADALLRAEDSVDLKEYHPYRTTLARRALAAAGPGMLPTLHRALGSTDRVVRSNAARALGTLGDRSSIAPLIGALDLESGLSRASIVWALGELRATEAIPRLTTLFMDVKNDTGAIDSSGGGFRAAQMDAVLQRDYAKLASLDDIAADWKPLTLDGCMPRCGQLPGEQLLNPRLILEALARIGTAPQTFYRSLVSEPRYAKEAARGLALATGADRIENVRILLTLLGDRGAQMSAAVSLVELREDEPAHTRIVEWLQKDDETRHSILDALGHARDPQRIAFTRAAVEAIAADANTPEYVRAAARKVLALR